MRGLLRYVGFCAAAASVIVASFLWSACGPAGDVQRDFVVTRSSEFVAPDSGLLAVPMDMAVDDKGRVYVLDWRESRIAVFNHEGLHIATIGQEGGGPGELRRPTGLWVVSDTLHIMDMRNGRMQRLLRSGEYVDVRPLPAGANLGRLAWWPSGRHVVATMGQQGALARMVDRDGQLVSLLGTSLAPPELRYNTAQIKQDAAAGNVPAIFRNTARPVAASDGGAWLVLQGEGVVERYDDLGARLWAEVLTVPEVDIIRRQFFEANADPSNPGIEGLEYAADAFAVGDDLWILLEMPDDQPATVIVLGATGQITSRILYNDLRGVGHFALDRERRLLYFANTSDASVSVAPLPEEF